MPTLPMGRRHMLQGAAAVVAAPFLNLGNHQLFAATPRSYSTRAVDLVRQALVIDMLAPLVLDDELDILAKPISDKWRADFKASGVTAMQNAVGIGGPDAPLEVAQYLAAWSGFVGRNGDVLSLVGRPEDIDHAKAQGKVAIIMGIQNSDHFRKAEDVKLYYLLGQRVSQLTYNSQNLIGSGSTEREDGGLSELGVEVVAAMNGAGMLVDVSHCGDRTTLDAIAMSKTPIAITHSNCRALNDHPRLKTDEAIKALAAKGGVMGMTAVRQFVRDREPTTIDHLIDHVDHAAKLVGIEHVGIGSDMDLYGYDNMTPARQEKLKAYYKGKYRFRDRLDTDDTSHPQRIYDITEGLIRRGYSDAQITGVLGGNFRRLLGTVWI
jgi:membrane dipeptidase